MVTRPGNATGERPVLQTRLFEHHAEEAIEGVGRLATDSGCKSVAEYLRRLLYTELRRAGESWVSKNWCLAPAKEDAAGRTNLGRPESETAPLSKPSGPEAAGRFFVDVWVAKPAEVNRPESLSGPVRRPCDFVLELRQFAGESITGVPWNPMRDWAQKTARRLSERDIESDFKGRRQLWIVGGGRWSVDYWLPGKFREANETTGELMVLSRGWTSKR